MQLKSGPVTPLCQALHGSPSLSQQQSKVLTWSLFLISSWLLWLSHHILKPMSFKAPPSHTTGHPDPLSRTDRASSAFPVSTYDGKANSLLTLASLASLHHGHQRAFCRKLLVPEPPAPLEAGPLGPPVLQETALRHGYCCGRHGSEPTDPRDFDPPSRTASSATSQSAGV